MNAAMRIHHPMTWVGGHSRAAHMMRASDDPPLPTLRWADYPPYRTLTKVASGIPGLRLVILGGSRDGNLQLAASGASFDVANLEGLEGVARLAEKIGVERVLFGSHSPFFIWEAARLKVTEAGLHPSRERAVLGENARRLLEGSR
jgi:hypothetical protein